ncbi:hypothetical protein GCM10027032_12160 [Simplicispira piscis]
MVRALRQYLLVLSGRVLQLAAAVLSYRLLKGPVNIERAIRGGRTKWEEILRFHMVNLLL